LTKKSAGSIGGVDERERSAQRCDGQIETKRDRPGHGLPGLGLSIQNGGPRRLALDCSANGELSHNEFAALTAEAGRATLADDGGAKPVVDVNSIA
jgi:hypothetical protein